MSGMNDRFTSNAIELACHIARPSGDVEDGPGVILCHGFPIGPLDASEFGRDLPAARRSHGPRTRLRDDDVQLPRLWRQRGRLLAAGLGRRSAFGDLAPGDHQQPVRCDPRRDQHRRIDRDLCGCRRPASVGGRVAEPPCRLRRLGGAAPPVPRARPGDRGDPRPPVPGIGRRVVARVPPLPPGGVGPPVRAAAAAGDARRGRRQRAGVRCRASWSTPTATPS